MIVISGVLKSASSSSSSSSSSSVSGGGGGGVLTMPRGMSLMASTKPLGL